MRHICIEFYQKCIYNYVYQGAVFNINQICQVRILIPKPLKCLFMCQLKFAIETNKV